MTPYADALSFGVLLYAALAAVAAGLAARLTWRWVLAATVALAALQAWAAAHPAGGAAAAARSLWLLLAWGALQLAVARVFLRRRARDRSTAAVALAVALSLAPLAVAKVAPLVAPATTAGFLGLSYITFRALDVLIGIHDGLVKSLPPGRHLAYLLFFPTLSSGPIDRWKRFDADLGRARDRATVLADAGEGVRRVFLGLLLKFVLAATVQRWWLEPASGATGLAATASYMYAYSAFLYLDFAGYSHMAIGVSRVFGIHTPENFDRPWRATTIADFWNRWHMSLSFWFRDHVYMRVVLAAKRHRWPLAPVAASSLGFLVTFLLMGAWHGLAWHYIAYGLYHATLLSAHQALSRRGTGRPPWRERGRAWRAASIALTVQLVCIGFLIFSGRLG